MAKNHDSAQHSGLSLDVQPQFSSDAEPLVGTSSKFKEYLELQKPPAPYSQRRSPVDFWKLTSLQDFYTFSHSQDWQYPVIDSNQHENSLDKGTTRCDSQAQSAISKKRQNESRETLNRNEQHLAKNQDYTIFQKSCDKVNSSSTHRALNESVPFKKGPLKLRKSWFNPRNKSLAYHCKHFAKESEQQTNEQELFVLDFPDEHALEMEVLEGIYKNTNRQRRFQMPTNFGTLVENQTEEFYLNENTNSEASCSPSQSCQQCQKSCSPMEKLTNGTITITPNYEKAGPPVPPKSNGLTLGSKTPFTQNPAIKIRKHADVQLSKVSITKPYYKKSNLTISKQLSLAHENDDSIDSPPPFTGTYFPPRQQQFDVYGFVRHNYYSHLKPNAQSPAKKQSSGSNLARKGATNQPKGEKPAVSFQNRVSMHTINGTKAQHNLQNHEIHPHHDPHHHEHNPHHHHQHHNPNRLSHVRHSSSASSPHSHERGKSYVYLNDLDQHQYPTAVDEHLDVATCRPAARTFHTPAALAPAINDEDDDESSTKSADRPKLSTSQSSSYLSSSSSSDLGNMKKKLKVFPANHHKKRKHKDHHGKHSADILPHHNSTQEFNVTKGDETAVSEPASENSKKGSTSSKLEEQASDDDGDTEGSSTSNGSSSKSSKKHKDSTDSSGTSNSTSKSKGRSCDETSQKKALSTNPCCYYINTCPSYTYGYQPSGYYGYGGYPGAAQSAYALPNSAYGTYGSPYDPNVYSGTQWPSGPFSCCYPPHTEGPHQASHMEKLSSSRCASPNKETPPPACQAPGYNQQPFSPWMNQCLEPFKDMNTNCFQLSPNVFSGQANPPTQTQDLNGNYSQNGYFGNPYCCPMIFYCCPPQPEPPKDKKPCRRKKVTKKNVFQLPPALTSFPDKPRRCTMESPPKCNNCCPDDCCCASDGDCCNNFCCVENCKCPFGML